MRYNARNTIILEGLHPAFKYPIIHLLEKLEMRGEDILLYDGFRSIEDQNIEWRRGRDANGKVIGKTVTNAKGGDSFHNYGFAVDFAPVILGVPLSRRNKLEWAAKARYELIGTLAEGLGLEWGGRWEIVDSPHLQIKGLTVEQLRNGKTLSEVKSKNELLNYYKRRLDAAIHGLENTSLQSPRFSDLLDFIVDTEQKIERLG